ncbi:hypothetical protein DM01DRAFT_1335363 [Hesseltinella vesiculosa]|uniref:Uncharacterized protein n=1 Tax=Hesseltinella vesiculosa TaxID=101127 RepID=A0A1X2GJ88_9FUNG|nr:hypothetical protein DM01DRAFT_1335363 [Hesseltinella vesiculosa]
MVQVKPSQAKPSLGRSISMAGALMFGQDSLFLAVRSSTCDGPLLVMITSGQHTLT